jgi:hypothetical protein
MDKQPIFEARRQILQVSQRKILGVAINGMPRKLAALRYNIVKGSQRMWRNRKGFKQKAFMFAIAERLPVKTNEIKGFMGN